MAIYVLDDERYRAQEEELAAREYIILLTVSASSFMHAEALRRALAKRGYDIALRDFAELLWDMNMDKGYLDTRQEDGSKFLFLTTSAFLMPLHLKYKLTRIGFSRRKQLCSEMASRHASQPKHCV